MSNPPYDDRPLPSIGLDISRPSSAASTVNSTSYNPQQRHGSGASSVQLPALSTLASVASTSPTSANHSNVNANGNGNGSTNGNNNHQSNKDMNDVNDNLSVGRITPPKKTSTPPLPLPVSMPPLQQSKPSNGHSMTYATAAPATSGGQTNGPPVCQNCTTSTTPLWRRDESGSVLCNACGLFLKLHGRPRPISLKTDVIKSRNRVKAGGPGGRKKAGETNGLPAAHPDADGSMGLAQHRRASGKISSGLSDRSQSPISRTGTPGFPNGGNIAPQHMFDGALHGDFHSPSLPNFALRHPSPSATSSINGSHLEPPLSYDALTAQNTSLRTRVSELEVINDLFRGRVTELETSEQEARRQEAAVRTELEESKQREAELKRRLDEIENDGPRHKKMRLSDIVDDSRAGTPISSLGE